ncbi:MAG: glutamyl-tRNA synthetase [Luteibaculaceae bacterium]|jgi:glutamyl-tRNA synthetase
MSDRKVRVRFAPSPTGPLHIGGVRTALYNYLFAKKHGGDFLLRIEDTDQNRLVPGAEEYIIESLKWCGINPDEGQGIGGDFGPYKQSERKPMYRQFADKMIENGTAYYAFDTSEELDAMRERLKQARVAAPQYNNTTRMTMKNSLTLSPEDVAQRLASGEEYVVRVKMPRNEEVRFEDAIRGWVVVNTDNMDDKVLLKNDGMPTYHLANIVDDYHMNISHVIRGEEWLPSAPLHILLYRYLGWEENTPTFAHLPLILKPDGNGKLSKRDGDRLGFPVFPLEWKDPETQEVSSGYRENGYIPEGFINMLAFLGWNPGTEQELFSLEELIAAFTLPRVGKSGAKFDPEKTNWFNQQFLRRKSDAELAFVLNELLQEKGIDADLEKCEKAIPMLKERAVFYSDLLEGMYLFVSPSEYDEKTVKKKWKENTPELLRGWKESLSGLENYTAEEIETAFKGYLETKEIGMGQLLPAFRLALTGLGMGPSMFMIADVLGKDESVARMEIALTKLG